MNNVVLIGRLTRNPDLRHTTTGMAVTTFTLAVDRPFSKDNEADFIRIVVYGKPAEHCGTYLAKGSKAAVQGRIQTGSYEKDGQTVYTTDVVADRVEFLSKPNQEQKTAATPKEEAKDIPDGFQEYTDDEYDEDVLF